MIKKLKLPLSLILAFLVSAIIGFSDVQARSISKSTLIAQLQSRYQWVYIENSGSFTQLSSSVTGGYDKAAQDYAKYLSNMGRTKIYIVNSGLNNALKQYVGYTPATPDPEVAKAVKARGITLYCFEADVYYRPAPVVN